MSPTHHLTDETLQDYAAGSLGTPMETLVACHLTMCARCRARSIFADAVGGSLFDEQDESPVRVTAAEVLARAVVEGRTVMPETGPEPVTAPGVDGKSQTRDDSIGRRLPRVSITAALPEPGGVPRPLARLLPTALDDLDWRRLAPGIHQFDLAVHHRRHGAFKLLHLAPGVTLNEHGHNERELTYVVRGSYTDELGRFRAGDIADLDEIDERRPVVDESEPCIALIATHSPVRFSGMLGRITQPFART